MLEIGNVGDKCKILNSHSIDSLIRGSSSRSILSLSLTSILVSSSSSGYFCALLELAPLLELACPCSDF